MLISEQSHIALAVCGGGGGAPGSKASGVELIVVQLQSCIIAFISVFL